MAKAKISDSEFMAIWNELKSAIAVSRATGITERHVHSRRRRIEARMGVALESAATVAAHYSAYHDAYKSPQAIKLGIENGTILVFSDAHFLMHQRTTAFKALLWLIDELKPSVIINNGDAFDGASVSRHPVNDWTPVPSVLEELKACQMYLGEIEDAAPQAKLVWTLGNHDARFSARLAAAAPQFRDVQGFTLPEHFEKWTHTMSCWVTDDLMVKHRWKGGIHATHNNTVGSGVSFCTGHLHSLKVTPWTDYKGTRWGVDCGTLADPFGEQFNYAENNPRNWRQGFAVLNVRDGRLVTPELCMTVGDGQVDWRGEVWDVSEF